MNCVGWLVVALAGTEILLVGGAIFGWASLSLTLVRDGVYHNLCQPAEITCDAQKLRLSITFAVSAAFATCVSVLFGWAADNYGPRATHAVAALMNCLGNVLLAISSSELDAFIPGCMLMAGGGMGIFLSHLHLGDMDPACQGRILALLNGAFDASPLGFLVLDELNLQQPWFTRSRIFAGLSMLGLVIFGSSFVLSPSLRQKHEKRQPLLDDAIVQASDNSSDMFVDSVIKDLEEASQPSSLTSTASFPLRKQLTTTKGLLLTTICAFSVLRFNFYFATVESQLGQLTDSEEAKRFVHYFNLAVGLASLSMPLCGYFLDRRGLAFTFGCAHLAGLLFSITSMVSSLQWQIVSFITFSIYRAWTFGCLAHYIAVLFGVTFIGRMFGAIGLIAGLFSLFQYPLVALTLGPLDNNFMFTNLFLLFLALFEIYAIYPIHKFETAKMINDES